jgi:hypothetical protein
MLSKPFLEEDLVTLSDKLHPSGLTGAVWRDPDLASWWVAFLTVAPAMADRLVQVKLVDAEEAARRSADMIWSIPKCAFGSGWVFLDGSPKLHSFLTIAIGAAYNLKLEVAQHLAVSAHKASEHRSEALAIYTHLVAEAAGTWSVGEVEERLGISIGKAYLQARTPPLWLDPAQQDPLETDGEYRPGDPQTYVRYEPQEFVWNCLEGLYYEDDLWSHYAEKLFGPIPDDLPAPP